MRRVTSALLGLSLASTGVVLAAAQEQQMQASGPPKILEIQREFLKPGKAGVIHDRSEANFVQAFAHAKWPTHYVALNSVSGPSRALFLVGYPSFEAWQKDEDATMKDTALSASLERSEESDGDLLTSFDQVVFIYNRDLSLNPVPDLANVRFMEVTAFKLRPGHDRDWENLVKLYKDGIQKAGISDANWAMYHLAYGGGDDYTIFSTDKSMADMDAGMADGKKFRDAVGDDGLKQIDELMASAVISVNSQLFEINPRQSYPRPEWVKENPSFWNPKPMMTSAKKPGTAKSSSEKKGGQ